MPELRDPSPRALPRVLSTDSHVPDHDKLNRLLYLRKQVDAAIAAERRRRRTNTKRRVKAAASATTDAWRSCDACARTPTKAIKQWAVATGLLPTVERGRLGNGIAAKYHDHHHKEDQ